MKLKENTINNMKKRSLLFGLVSLAISLFAQNNLHYKSKVELVDPFIGTAFRGHTYPGAVAPWYGAIKSRYSFGWMGWM